MPLPAILGAALAAGSAAWTAYDLFDILNNATGGGISDEQRYGARGQWGMNAAARIAERAAMAEIRQENRYLELGPLGPSPEYVASSVVREQELADLLYDNSARLAAMSQRAMPSPVELALRMGAL